MSVCLASRVSVVEALLAAHARILQRSMPQKPVEQHVVFLVCLKYYNRQRDLFDQSAKAKDNNNKYNSNININDNNKNLCKFSSAVRLLFWLSSNVSTTNTFSECWIFMTLIMKARSLVNGGFWVFVSITMLDYSFFGFIYIRQR